MLRLLSFLILTNIFLFSCSTPEEGYVQKSHSILESQRLILRNGKLSNRICTEAKKGKCVSWSIEDHDISKKEVRDHLNNVGFVCNIQSKRYFLCPDSEAFCRKTLTCAKWKRRLILKDICLKYQVEEIGFDALNGILVDCFSGRLK